MAEAILFGHRALQPLIDLQEELQKAVGKAKRTPFIEAGTGSVLDFAAGDDAGDEFVVIDVETTGTDPKMADLVEIAAVKVKGGKIVDRWSTFVEPGPVRSSATRCTASPTTTSRAPRAPGRGRQALDFVGDALDRRPLGRLRPRLHRGGPGRRHPRSSRAATSTR